MPDDAAPPQEEEVPNPHPNGAFPSGQGEAEAEPFGEYPPHPRR